MPNYSDFLNLTLPEFAEFVDSWNEPVNNNFEAIDDWTADLYNNLVGSGSGATWSALRGSHSNLADRLAVSINGDGTIDVSSSAEITSIATSGYNGVFSTPQDRLDDGDREVYDANQPAAGGRFDPILPSGPSAGFPHEELDAGIALRSADFGARTAEPIASPHTPWAPGLVIGGADPLITGSGTAGQVQLNASSVAAIFNIDGYIFRLREDLLFDYALLSPSPNDYVWIYVERKDANYNDANFRYSEPGGTPAAKDLRILRTGSDGITSTSTFSSAASTWDTAPFKVKKGDILRITSGGAAGDYIIDALDGSTPNTKLTVKGIFRDDLSAVPFQIIDNAMPNIGAALAASVPSDPTSRPPFEEGRVYVGRVKHLGSGSPDPRVTFSRGGVYDSGWLAITNIATDFPLVIDHNLGAIPSSVEVWVRVDSTSPAYRPLVRRQVLTNFDEGDTTVDAGDAKKADLLFPSTFHYCSEVQTTIDVLNETTDPANATALFTDSGGTDQTIGEIRVISRR